jgi:hypothetical protein
VPYLKLLVESYVDTAFQTANHPIPPWLRALEQVALQPGGLVLTVARDGLNPVNSGDHPP